MDACELAVPSFGGGQRHTLSCVSRLGLPRQLAALLKEVDQLETLGATAQGVDESEAEVATRELQGRYPGWYAAAYEALPPDLRTKFKAEYEGSLVYPKIKQYIAQPRQRWALYEKRIPNFFRRHGQWQYQFAASFQKPLREQGRILIMAQGRLGINPQMLQVLDLLSSVSRRLPRAFILLGRTQRGRDGITISDEYDLQRILHALLVVHFDDVEAEDTTSRKAGGSFRIDFVLRDEKVAVEAKMTRENLGAKQVRDQLLEDIFGYKAHVNVSAFFGVVYDPLRQIDNPSGFENDINADDPDFPIRIVVAQG